MRRAQYRRTSPVRRLLIFAAALVSFATVLRLALGMFGEEGGIPAAVRYSLMYSMPGFKYEPEELPVFELPSTYLSQAGSEEVPGTEDTEKVPDPQEPVTVAENENEAEAEYGEEMSEFPIQEISVKPASTAGYLEADGVLVKNSTGYDVDVGYLLKRPLPYNLTSKGAQVLIIHSHGSEAYTEPGLTTYDPETDSNRSKDPALSVVRVGDEIAKVIEEAGIEVIHDKTMYDLPNFNKSYEASLEGIKKHLKENPSIKVIIDVHRDAMVTDKGVKYKPVAEFGGEKCAQVMLVMGTGENGLSHEYWKENLKLALRLQKRMNDESPGLARPIDLRKDRFNQHATMGSMLVEVGSSGNTLEEAINGGRRFAEALAAELVKIKK